MPYSPEMAKHMLTPLARAEPLFNADALQMEAEYENGRALGVPAKALFGVELDYHFVDFGAAGVPQVAESYGLTDSEVKDRRRFADSTVRQEIYEDIAAMEPGDDRDRERRQEWLEQVPRLSMDEIMTYIGYSFLTKLDLGDYQPDIGRALDQTEDSWDMTLEPAFGQALYQTGGYYDNPNCFEKRTLPGSLNIMLARVNRAINTFRAIGEYFGYDYRSYSSQMTMSVHVDRGNGYELMHDLFKPEGREIARLVVGGMLEAIDAATILQSLARIDRLPPGAEALNYTAGLTRNSTLRVLPKCFEWRIGEGEKESLAGQALTLMSGFSHGYRRPNADAAVETILSERRWYMPGLNYVKVRDLYILRALQNADFDAGGIPQLKETDSLLTAPRALHTITALCGIPQLPETIPPDPYDAGPTLNGLLATIQRNSTDRLICGPNKYDAWLHTISHPILRRLIDEAPEGVRQAANVTARIGRVKEIVAQEVSGQTSPLMIGKSTLHALMDRFERAGSLEGFSTQTRRDLVQHLERQGYGQRVSRAIIFRRARRKTHI